MAEKIKIAGFALVDDFEGDNLKKLGNCLYQKNIVPGVISLKKGRNVVDKDKTMMTETDYTFARARTQINVLIMAADYSIDELMNHNPFRKLVEMMIKENQPVVAMGKAPIMLAEVGVAKGLNVTGNKESKKSLREAGANVSSENFIIYNNLITAASIEQWNLVCSSVSEMMKKAA